MGIFGGGYKNPLIPGCRWLKNESSEGTAILECDADKVLDGKTIGGERPIRFAVENGMLHPLDEGKRPQALIEDVMHHIQRNMRARKISL